jgi:Pyridoxamine 5'-phosphate oxidase
MRVTPSDPTPAELAALRALLDRSTQTATPAVAYPTRQMSAAEFLEFWRSVRLVAMATVGRAGQSHIAPVHAELAGTTLRLRIYEDTVRRQDLAANLRVAFTTWRADGAVGILYGRAREAPGSLRPARPGQSGRPRRGVRFEVRLTRISALRAPERESNLAAQAWIRIGDPALLSDLRDFFRRWAASASRRVCPYRRASRPRSSPGPGKARGLALALAPDCVECGVGARRFHLGFEPHRLEFQSRRGGR